MSHTDHHDTDPVIAELLDDAFVGAVDVETAARHLWAIHAAAQEQEQVREQARPEPVPSLAGRRIPRTAVPLLALVMVMSSSGVAVAASQGSLPGDVLYPVKRGTERAQLIFARDPVTRAELQARGGNSDNIMTRDSDGDNALTQAEFLSQAPGFTRADRNRDGVLGPQELARLEQFMARARG